MKTENTGHQLWVNVTDNDEALMGGLWALLYHGETCKVTTYNDL